MRFLVPVLILVIISLVGFYFYRKANPLPHVPTQAEIEESQRQELMSYSIDPATAKSEGQQKKELETFGIPKKNQLTEEEMRQILIDANTNQ